MIAATVIADRPAIEGWIKSGVKDSKKITETQIIKLDKIIRGTSSVVVRTCFCGMPKYNELMAARARTSTGSLPGNMPRLWSRRWPPSACRGDYWTSSRSSL